MLKPIVTLSSISKIFISRNPFYINIYFRADAEAQAVRARYSTETGNTTQHILQSNLINSFRYLRRIEKQDAIEY